MQKPTQHWQILSSSHPQESQSFGHLRQKKISSLPVAHCFNSFIHHPLKMSPSWTPKDYGRTLSRVRFLYRCATFVLFFCLFEPVTLVPKNLSLPNPSLCAGRKIHVNNLGGGSGGYYVSWLERGTRNTFLNWLDARNWCRERCMDLISMENPAEIQFVKRSMQTCKLNFMIFEDIFKHSMAFG